MTKEEYVLNPNNCKFCKETIPYNKRKRARNKTFCKIQCFNAYDSFQKRIEYEKCPKLCLVCKKEIPFLKRIKNDCCGNSCAQSLKMKLNPFTDEQIVRIKTKTSLTQKKLWTKEKRLEHSLKMKKIVDDNPESYSSKNVCGRVKTIKTIDSLGNETNCLGKWELLVIDYLNKNNIRWTNKIEENFQYYWNESHHRYFPDFKLLDYDNVFIEVKGYERDRDKAKWEQFPHKLIIIKKEEIEKLKTNRFQLTFENLAV